MFAIIVILSGGHLNAQSFVDIVSANTSSEVNGIESLPETPIHLIGNGDPYNEQIESSLQTNYIYRWPVPFIDGYFEVNVQLHYIHLSSNSVPTSDIDAAIAEVQRIYGDHDLNINFLILEHSEQSGCFFIPFNYEKV